uniref:Uncharacterized protein n=1 Tax=Caenorhabditis japonica TaxID=281687 RepID=A0A8R1EN29_CAEJA
MSDKHNTLCDFASRNVMVSLSLPSLSLYLYLCKAMRCGAVRCEPKTRSVTLAHRHQHRVWTNDSKMHTRTIHSS